MSVLIEIGRWIGLVCGVLLVFGSIIWFFVYCIATISRKGMSFWLGSLWGHLLFAYRTVTSNFWNVWPPDLKGGSLHEYLLYLRAQKDSGVQIGKESEELLQAHGLLKDPLF